MDRFREIVKRNFITDVKYIKGVVEDNIDLPEDIVEYLHDKVNEWGIVGLIFSFKVRFRKERKEYMNYRSMFNFNKMEDEYIAIENLMHRMVKNRKNDMLNSLYNRDDNIWVPGDRLEHVWNNPLFANTGADHRLCMERLNYLCESDKTGPSRERIAVMMTTYIRGVDDDVYEVERNCDSLVGISFENYNIGDRFQVIIGETEIVSDFILTEENKRLYKPIQNRYSMPFLSLSYHTIKIKCVNRPLDRNFNSFGSCFTNKLRSKFNYQVGLDQIIDLPDGRKLQLKLGMARIIDRAHNGFYRRA